MEESGPPLEVIARHVWGEPTRPPDGPGGGTSPTWVAYGADGSSTDDERGKPTIRSSEDLAAGLLLGSARSLIERARSDFDRWRQRATNAHAEGNQARDTRNARIDQSVQQGRHGSQGACSLLSLARCSPVAQLGEGPQECRREPRGRATPLYLASYVARRFHRFSTASRAFPVQAAPQTGPADIPRRGLKVRSIYRNETPPFPRRGISVVAQSETSTSLEAQRPPTRLR